MRKGMVAIVMAGTSLLGPVSTAAAQEPPRGPCNRGTMNAHERVPHRTQGNETAHERIPHCPHGG